MNKTIDTGLISASILSADFSNLATEVKKVSAAGADYVHFDIMDGHFVPSLTFGPMIVKSLRKLSDKPFDVHIMASNPEQYIAALAEAGADIITVHVEATNHLDRVLALIKSYGIKAGVSLNPASPMNFLQYIMDKLDLILVMSVNPGFGGQKFIPAQLQKISQIKNLITKSGHDIKLEVDGGIDETTAKLVYEAGADILVSGSYIFNSDNYAEKIQILKKCK